MKDLTGQQIGNWFVESFAFRKDKNYYWNVVCICGTKRLTQAVGRAKSCGCIRDENMKNNNRAYKHGMDATKFYRIWQGIKRRCNNKNDPAFVHYGGRGIKCLWNSFEEFRYDMYESYMLHEKKYGGINTSIDRIDNEGHYEKSNCKWATKSEQMRNKRDNRLITLDGETKCIAEWADIFGIDAKPLYRLDALEAEVRLYKSSCVLY